MGRRRYGTFTPARRAALHRAQLISAQKRKAQGRRATRVKYAKRAAVGVGVLGAVGATGYAGHRLAGNQLIISKRTPTPTIRVPHTTADGLAFKESPVGPGTGLRKRGKSISYTSRNKKGDKTILYAMGVRRGNTHGSKIGGAPMTVTQHKPTRADIKNMQRHNRPKVGSEQYAREAMMVGHTTAHTYVGRKIEAGEAIRRTNSYVKAMEGKGKKVSEAHRRAASAFFANQPRYTGGTVKPLKRLSRRRARRLYAKQQSFSQGPTVLGSRKKQTPNG